MQVLLDPAGNTGGQDFAVKGSRPSVGPAAQAASQAVSKPTPAADTKKATPPSGLLQANVTFRRDKQGQIYYVVTDAATGKEIRQMPPQEVRKTGEGIEEFLKEQQAKEAYHVEVKA